ncbi:MAG: hypothetical protein IKN24_04965 [Lachnospiraceae bacterium]|nr:hypothetical protein [Lachnospiraceae bacterium]
MHKTSITKKITATVLSAVMAISAAGCSAQPSTDTEDTEKSETKEPKTTPESTSEADTTGAVDKETEEPDTQEVTTEETQEETTEASTEPVPETDPPSEAGELIEMLCEGLGDEGEYEADISASLGEILTAGIHIEGTKSGDEGTVSLYKDYGNFNITRIASVISGGTVSTKQIELGLESRYEDIITVADGNMYINTGSVGKAFGTDAVDGYFAVPAFEFDDTPGTEYKLLFAKTVEQPIYALFADLAVKNTDGSYTISFEDEENVKREVIALLQKLSKNSGDLIKLAGAGYHMTDLESNLNRCLSFFEEQAGDVADIFPGSQYDVDLTEIRSEVSGWLQELDTIIAGLDAKGSAASLSQTFDGIVEEIKSGAFPWDELYSNITAYDPQIIISKKAKMVEMALGMSIADNDTLPVTMEAVYRFTPCETSVSAPSDTVKLSEIIAGATGDEALMSKLHRLVDIIQNGGSDAELFECIGSDFKSVGLPILIIATTAQSYMKYIVKSNEASDQFKYKKLENALTMSVYDQGVLDKLTEDEYLLTFTVTDGNGVITFTNDADNVLLASIEAFLDGEEMHFKSKKYRNCVGYMLVRHGNDGKFKVMVQQLSEPGTEPDFPEPEPKPATPEYGADDYRAVCALLGKDASEADKWLVEYLGRDVQFEERNAGATWYWRVETDSPVSLTIPGYTYEWSHHLEISFNSNGKVRNVFFGNLYTDDSEYDFYLGILRENLGKETEVLSEPEDSEVAFTDYLWRDFCGDAELALFKAYGEGYDEKHWGLTIEDESLLFLER